MSDVKWYPSGHEDDRFRREVERIESLSPEQVDGELRRLGVDPQPTIDAVRQLLKDARDRRSATSRMPVTPPHKTVFDAWPEARHAVYSLRSCSRTGSRRAAMLTAFGELAHRATKVRFKSIADVDAAWPLVEAAEEIGIEVANDPDLWSSWSVSYALLCLHSEPAMQCMFVHGLKELLERGEAARQMVLLTCSELLVGDPSDEACVLIGRMATRNVEIGRRVSKWRGRWFSPRVRAISDDIDGRRNDALAACEQSPRANWFETNEVKELEAHAASTPLTMILSMDGVAAVYVKGATLDQKQSVFGQAGRGGLADRVFHRLRDDSSSHFFTVETMEGVRDQYPAYAATILSDLIPQVPIAARHALFVCMVEGYERSFAGVRQRSVPQFNLEELRFTPAEPNKLDVFCQSVCSSSVAGELIPHMQWANDRFALWLMK